jgi:hypothetical protein
MSCEAWDARSSLASQSRRAALDNGWGLRGWTRAVLAALTKDELSAALALASARAKPAALLIVDVWFWRNPHRQPKTAFSRFPPFIDPTLNVCLGGAPSSRAWLSFANASGAVMSSACWRGKRMSRWP